MSIPFHDNIDFLSLEALNFRFQVLSTDPAGVQGFAYFNSADLHPRVHDGNSFRVLGFATTVTPTALTVAGAASVGSGLNYARDDHAHAMPGLATAVASGFMSSTDKSKLDNATASPTPLTLMYRDAAGRSQAADPSSAQDVATLGWVLSQITQLDNKASVRARTVGNINIASPGASHDGVTLTSGNRLLVVEQSAPAENGIYIFNGATSALTRSTDADAWTELVSAYTIVEEGTLYKDTAWLCTVDTGGTLGTTAVTWEQRGNAISYSAANDPTITGIGVFNTTVGTQFRFRAVKAGSTKVSATLTGQDILIDVNESNLNLANLGGILGVAHGGTGGTTPLTARQGISAAGRFETLIGNGASTSFNIAHNLGSERVVVEVWETTGLKRKVQPRVQTVDSNTITVTFATGAPASNSYSVVVLG